MTVREATVIARAADARRLGRYILVGDIAEGGMGRIYLARALGHAGFERLVAVKVMHQRLADQSPELADMFLDEARITALVRHPNVCAVTDFGEQKGVRFLVMEYMVGQTLLEVLRRLHQIPNTRQHPAFWAYAARIIAEACEGLHAAHTAIDEQGRPLGVVHRDISPENLYLTYDGTVKVFDFGIARAAGRRHQTVAGIFKGKFSYASPEAYGAGGLDARSDVWSMGIVLWELLTGAPLFHRPTEAEILGAIFRDPIPTPSAVRPDVPRELDRIATVALSREPIGRYPSARDMARDLNRFAIGLGQHVGGAEIAEWMQALFQNEHQAALESSRMLKRLDSTVDQAPELSSPSQGVASRVVARSDRAELQSAPTVLAPEQSGTPTGRALPPPTTLGDDDEATQLAAGPVIAEITAEGETMEILAPEDREVSTGSHKSVGAGYPAPFEGDKASDAAGAPSPFAQAPPPKKRSVVGTIFKILFAAAALVGGIFLADYLTNSPTSPLADDTPPEPAPPLPTGGETTPPGGQTAPPGGGTTEMVDPGTIAPEGGETPTPTPTPTPEAGEAVEPEDETPDEVEPVVVAMRSSEPTPRAGQPTAAELRAERDRARAEERARARAERSAREAAEREARAEERRLRRERERQQQQQGGTATPTMEAAASGEPGTVSVFAIGGWADIFEGGNRLGRTPARLTLPAGRHTLTLRPPEGPERRQTVTVPAGGTARVQVELAPE